MIDDVREFVERFKCLIEAYETRFSTKRTFIPIEVYNTKLFHTTYYRNYFINF